MILSSSGANCSMRLPACAQAPRTPAAIARPPAAPAISNMCRRVMVFELVMMISSLAGFALHEASAIGPPNAARAAERPQLFLLHRHRDAGNLQVDRAQGAPAGEVERSPVVAAERDIGGRGLPVDDAAELLALWIEDMDPVGAAAVDVACRIDLHAVGHAGLGAAQVREHP